jgi:uncharacterized membrane protein YozB (DUF420 family)
MEDYLLPCMFKKFFGIDCIGCGIQRSILLLFDGEFVAAFKMFPAIYSTVLLFLFLGLHLFEKKHAYHKWVIIAAIFNAVVMLVAYAIKMNFIN